MRRTVFLLLALGCVGSVTFAEARWHQEVVLGQSARNQFFSDKIEAVLCLNPVRGRRSALCALTFDRLLPAPGTTLTIQVNEICRTIRTQGSDERDWYLSPATIPGYHLYEIDCKRALARPLSASIHSDHEASLRETPLRNPTPTRRSDMPAAAATEDLPPLDTEPLRRAISDVQQQIERLRQEFLKELKTLRKPGKQRRASCFRVAGKHGSRDEVMVAVEGSVLRFLRIPAPPSVAIGLSEEAADELHKNVQSGSPDPVVPRIFLSVGDVTREVGDFYIQDRLIPNDLYARITEGKSSQRVSYNEARGFIDKVNRICSGRAQFDLPTEEQFLTTARMLYDPVNNGLKPCASLTDFGNQIQVHGLLGNLWQLTKSPCQSFPGQDPAGASCPQDSYIRKGGTAGSENPLECVPEYRSGSAAEVSQKDTTFRLVLIE